MKRPPLSSNGRRARCHYCQRTLEATDSRTMLAATRDHIFPKSHGGEYRVWCCKKCNSMKGDMFPDKWKKFMKENPEWWKLDMVDFNLRQRRVRSRDYLDFVKKFPCLVCGALDVDPHHVQYAEPKGTLKTSDNFAVPVCRHHHDAIHMSPPEQTWWALQGIDPLEWANKTWEHFQTSHGLQ